MDVRLCPKCGARVDFGAKFCAACGGKLRELSARPSEPEVERGPALPVRAALWLLELFPGLLRPGVVVLSLVGLVVALGVGYLAFFLFRMGAAISACFIGGFGVVVYWTSLTWLLYGDVVLPSEALTEFEGRHWSVLILLTLIPIAAGFAYARSQMGQ